jgi:hypothetical protein
MRIVRGGAAGVEVLHSPERRTARYGNVCACGNGWICPVCAARLSQKKADLLRDGLLRSPNIHPALFTFTMQHHRGQSLKECLSAVKGAYRVFQQSRVFHSLARETGLLAGITACEILHGKNGWHAHLHAIELFDRNYDSESIAPIEFEAAKLWRKSLQAHDQDCDLDHGLDAKAARYSVADYVAKFGRDPIEKSSRRNNWGIEREVALAHSKVARAPDSMSAQGLLLDSAGSPRSPSGRLFIEYADATAGNKILTISAKAKSLLGLDISIEADEHLLAERDNNEVILATLSRQQWALLLYPEDRRTELLNIAATGSSAEVIRLIRRICPELDMSI